MPNKKKNKKKAEQPVPNIPGMGPRPPPVAAGGDAPQPQAAAAAATQQQQDDEAYALAQTPILWDVVPIGAVCKRRQYGAPCTAPF